MTQFLQRKNLSDTRKGARFKKTLKTDEVAYGERIIDAGISSHYTDIFDGQFNFFPTMTIDTDGKSLEEGKAPIGNDHASVSYLLQFPTLTSPSFGSAELDSINLHLHMEDINYRNSFNTPDLEIYKFKKSLPHVGEWGKLRTKTGADDEPERILIGSSNYSEGPSLVESFNGSDSSTVASFTMPSLYRGVNTDKPEYYSTLDEAYEIDNSKNSYRLVTGAGMFGVSGDKNDRSSKSGKTSYGNAYAINWDGYGKIVKYELDSKHKVRPTGSNGLKKTWGDDPSYYLPYYNYAYAVSIGNPSAFRKELIHNKAISASSISTSDASISTNLKEELHSATMTSENTFFDDIWYTEIHETKDTTTEANVDKITAISHPHFSTVGGAASGQVGRIYSKVATDDDATYHMFKGDKTPATHTCLMKKIPKPLRLARQNGQDIDLNQMRIRIKFSINNMSKSHRSGKLSNNDVEGHVAGCNILRSFTAILATRPPESETLGFYINRLNTGDTTSVGYGEVDYSGEYDADSFAIQKDLYNYTSFSNVGNSQSRINFYNGVSFMNFVHGRGFQLTCDTDTSGIRRVEHPPPTNHTPKVGMAVSGAGIPENAFITAVDTSGSPHFFTINENLTATNNSVVLTFEDGRLDDTFGESQSSANPDDGTFTLFHTGNPDTTTRQNNWDAIYQCSVASSDAGSGCDFIPFVHKETGTSTGFKNMSRDRGTFTQDHDDIVSYGPNRNSFIKLDDETTGMRLDKKQWYYLDAYLNQDTATVCWVVSDSQERVIASVKQAHSGSVLTTTDNTHADDGFPAYLTLWVNNIRVGIGKNGGNEQPAARGEKVSTSLLGTYTERVDSEVDILIENITISNFEPAISNSTYIPGRKTVPSMTISGAREDKIPDLGSITIGEQIPKMEVDDISICTPTYLSWGAETDIWTGNKNHVFLGGYNSANPSFEDPTDADKRIKYGKTTTDANCGIRFFTTSNNAVQPMGFGCVSKGNEKMNEGVNVNPAVDIGTSSVRTGFDTPMMIDSFTKKGFFTITNPVWEADAEDDGTDGVWTKKENPMFSTKVLEWDVSNPYEMKVAQPEALSAFIDDDFVIYRAGYTWGTDVRRTGVKIKQITDDGFLTLEVPKDAHKPSKSDNDTALCHPKHLHEIYISPQKYWLICEIFNETLPENHLLGSKSFTHSCVLSDLQNPASLSNQKGLTFKETRYSDTTIDSNKWFHLNSAGDQSSLLETKIDYGYGSYSDENSQSYDGEDGLGYLNKIIPLAGENIIDIGGLADVENARMSNTDENITLLIKSAIDAQGGNTIVTTKYDDATKHPALTYVYRDALPTVTDFQVKPYEGDPFYPEFFWNTNDKDLWYGFLILDNEIIQHQYHKALVHIPFNEQPSGQEDEHGFFDFNVGKETFAYTYVRGGNRQQNPDKGTRREIGSRESMTDYYGNTLQDIVSIEGLAGNCINFTGNDFDGGLANKGPIIEYPLSTYGNPSGGVIAAQNNLSVIAHFTVDSLTKIDANNDDKGYILDDSNDAFGIWVDSTGKVNASVKTDDATTTCTLTSSYTVPIENDIPTSVILTVDCSLETGNVKLFVNGELEDQTGRKTTDGSVNNWKVNQKIEQYGTLRIGSEYVAGGLAKNQFNGKLEEMAIYNITIYPVNLTEGKTTIYKAIEELTGNSTIAAGRPINAKLIVKDYHNIRGTTVEEVAQTSQIAIRKSGFGLKTN